MIRTCLMLFLVLLLCGCAETYQIEKLGIASNIGVDMTDDNNLESTFIYYRFDPEVKKPVSLTSSKGKSFRGSINNANLNSGFKLVIGQLQTLVLSEELAKQGTSAILNTLVRDSRPPDMAHIAISKQPVKPLLNASFGNEDINMGNYLANLFENNIEHEILIENTLRSFLTGLNKVGRDPILPVLSLEKDKPIITDIALFKDDIFQETISMEEMFFLRLAFKNFKAGRLELKIPTEKVSEMLLTSGEDQLRMTLDSIKSSSNLTLTSAKNLSFHFDSTIETQLVETSHRLDLSEENKQKLEKVIEEHIKKGLEDLLKKLKELGVDPIGFGAVYNENTRNEKLTDKKWHEMFPGISVDFSINLEIKQHGLIK